MGFIFTRFLALLLGIWVVADAQAAGARTFRPERHSLGDTGVRRLQPIDAASWIWPESLKHEIDVAPPRFIRFRREFKSPGGSARIDVSADERFVLLVDGRVVGRGPNRGDICNWSYHTYDIEFPEGVHLVEAVVWRIGEDAPLAQLSYRGGFILKADGVFDALLSTGKADWEAGELQGTVPDRKLPSAGSWGCGSPFRVTGTGFLDEIPTVWKKTAVVRGPVKPNELTRYGYGARMPGWRLFPSQLEDQISTMQSPGRFISPGVIPGTFAPHTKTEVLWDLGDYYTAYPVLVTSGGRGAKVRWGWAEALRRGRYNFKTSNRAEWKDAVFDGFTDEFVSDGRDRAVFTTPWFRCGRWVKFTIETADEPLVILDNQIVESRYPLADTGSFSCDDPTIPDIRRICRRSMQMCAHDMLYDCPFYEQQMYPGDSRIQLNVLSVMDSDDRLIRRVIEIFDYGRRPDGMVPMNYPTRLHQESATYTMCWLMMFGDYARYNADREWLKARLPGMRAALEAVALRADSTGIIASLPGWSFMDWVGDWPQGVSPDGESALPGALNNLYWVLTLVNAAYVERAVGEEERAAIWENMAKKTFAAVERLFWDEKRGLYADTIRHDRYSEHAQCLALLSGMVPDDRRTQLFEKLISAPDLARCTVYFSYYLFQTYFRFDRGDLFLKRLDLWREYVRRDLKTTMERPDDGEKGSFESRSDCHAWGAHPLVWMQRGLAGVESDAPFFAKVRVAPSPGGLRRIDSRLPHPKGFIDTAMRFSGDGVSGEIRLPEGVPGTFVWKGREYPLSPGVNDLARIIDPSMPPRGTPPVLTPEFAPGLEDHTSAIQSALDKAARAGGGTVLIPPGEYRVSSLSIGANVKLELAGGVTDARKGYTEDLRRAADPSVSAVIRPTGKSTIGVLLFNFPLPATVDDGADGVTISGGVFDCEGRAKFLAFAPSRGIRIENVLVKDLMNDHAIQLDGCEESSVINCVFAGMDFEPGVKGRDCVMRETIQLEHTSPAALCNPSRSPLKCDDGDYRPCRDITVSGCWFGPSERFGSHLVPIGNHTSIRACKKLVINGNVFVDSRYCALRIANYVDGIVSGNTFVYNSTPVKLRDDAAIVTFWGECVLKRGETGFAFIGNRFETPKGFTLPRFNFGNGRAREVTVRE